MAFLTVQFFGESIGKSTAMNVILPPGRGPFPVMYLLHGLSDDYTIWARRTSIERYVADKKLIVVMPDGDRSFYCNALHAGGMAYEDHVTRDVVGFIDATFRTIRRREGRAIAGLSMGGYGACMLAMKHPGLFSAACSHSGALTFAHTCPANTPFTVRGDIQAIISRIPRDGRYDLFLLAEKFTRRRVKTTLRLDCGRKDFTLPANRLFHAHLKKLGIKHVYREYSGDHNWAYWDLHIQDSIAFIMKHLSKHVC
jgi:S-formylglutathione hydrolase FrmB